MRMQAKELVLLCFVLFLQVSFSFVPGRRLFSAQLSQIAHSQSSNTQLNAANTDKRTFGSKLFPALTQEELSAALKEFNITTMDLADDPELLKWAPSKEFFERFGFQNATGPRRTVSDVKTDFYATYRRPILPQYKTFVADLMHVLFLQRSDVRFQYDPLLAFGICTQYYTIMKGYALSEEIDVIFDALIRAVGFDPALIREDAKRILALVKESSLSEQEFLQQQDTELARIFHAPKTDRFFKYCDAWGVGLGRVMELRGVEVNEASFKRWTQVLRWVPVTRLQQSWAEFCGDQVKMQGVEAMQKQLLIREKRRAAERLEAKAAAFEDKKRALMELNEVIEQRRQQLIVEAMKVKKRFEPDRYEEMVRGTDRLLEAGGSA